jgi:hypothetical protein
VVQAGAPAIPDGTPIAGAGVSAPVVRENFNSSINLPETTALPSNGDRNQTAGKGSAKETNVASGVKNTGLDIATDSAKSKYTDVAGTGSDGSSHATQNSGQPIQHSQTDTTQGTAVAAKGMEIGASQVQATVTHTVAHEPATTLRGAGGSENASRQSLQRGDQAPNELDGSDAPATSGINAAKLIHTMSETGMNVGMRSSEFGNISIRTSVSPQQMTAQISLDHDDLSQALSSHVSSVQSKLENDYGLHTVIEVNQQGAASSGESGNSASGEQKEFVRSTPIMNAAVAAEPDIDLGPAAPVSTSNGLRLDIRA